MGQMDQPTTEEQELVYGLYYKFFSMAMGVIRDVEAPTYDEAVHAQIAEVQAKNPTRKLRELFLQQDIWEVK